MLYSRAGDYPPGQELIYAESFSPNTPEGACPRCHGLGRVYEVTEQSMVPDDSLSIRERAIAAWPVGVAGTESARHPRLARLRHRHAVARPAEERSRLDSFHRRAADRPGLRRLRSRRGAARAQAQGGAQLHGHLHRRQAIRAAHVRDDAERDDEEARRTVHARHRMPGVPRQAAATRIADGQVCRPRYHRDVATAARQAGGDAAPSRGRAQPRPRGSWTRTTPRRRSSPSASPKTSRRASRCCSISGSVTCRSSAARRRLSPGELQRLRLATQVRSNLFGVVYVLDEPSAGLHPVDTEALLTALDRLKASGNSLFVVEHDLDVMRHADWIVDVGPGAGEHGGRILYSGPPAGLERVEASKTRRHLFGADAPAARSPRTPKGWLKLADVTLQQSSWSRRRLPTRRVHDGDRRVGLGQVEPRQPGAGRAGRGAPGARASRR